MTSTAQEKEELLAEGRRLYERFGKPLEAEHWGKYVAIARDGRVLVSDDDRTLLRDALRTLGPGGFLFKIGPRAMGRGPSILRKCP